MAVVIVATVGAADANSYLTLAEAQAILAGRTDAANFLDEDDDTQKAHLIEATQWLQRRNYKGSRVDDVQRLAFPRINLPKPDSPTRSTFDDDAIPEIVQLAECELALGFYEQDDLESSSDGIASFSAGRVSVSYGGGAAGQAQSRYLTRAMQLLDGLIAPTRIERG